MLQSMGLQRVRHEWVTEQQNIIIAIQSTRYFICICLYKYSAHHSATFPLQLAISLKDPSNLSAYKYE